MWPQKSSIIFMILETNLTFAAAASPVATFTVGWNLNHPKHTVTKRKLKHRSL